MAGASRETVSRAMREFVEAGWVSTEKRRIRITDRVLDRVRQSLQYAVAKARRRGLKRIPPELLPYVEASQRNA